MLVRKVWNLHSFRYSVSIIMYRNNKKDKFRLYLMVKQILISGKTRVVVQRTWLFFKKNSLVLNQETRSEFSLHFEPNLRIALFCS